MTTGATLEGMPDAHLRRSVRDIVALTSLSAVWTGREPDEIAASLVNILRMNLDVALAAARVTSGGKSSIATAGTSGAFDTDAIARRLNGQAVNLEEPGFQVASAPLGYGAEYGRVLVWSRDSGFPSELQRLFLNVAVNQAAMALQAHSILCRERVTRQRMERLFEFGKAISAELDRKKLLQAITDAATELSGAQFGSFFYNVVDTGGESYMLYTLSGVPREHFSGFPMPRNTSLFGPTFRGEGVVRLGNVKQDPRYGKNPPYHGMPAGHLPVVSYLAVPVLSRSGEVLGGLFFGHTEENVFTEEHERAVISLAAQAAIALDNQQLFDAAEHSRRELQANNERISNILESIKDGFFAIDRNWQYTFVNERGAQIANRPRAELIGCSFWDVFATKGKMADALRRAMHSREVAQVEEYHPTRGVWLEMNAYPTQDGLAILLADVTEQKHFDEQLRQTQKLESLGLLAGGIAHDFNNLLTAILGNASLIREELDRDSTVKPLAEAIVEASERAAHLTSQLLAYAGKGRFVIEPVNLSKVIESITRLLHSSIPKTVRLELDLQADLPEVVADTAQMQQLIMNLVMNGAEAIPADTPGTLLVRTRTEFFDAGAGRRRFLHGEVAFGSYVCVEVRDNGVGMDEQTLARIFDPFFTTKFTGRGLGLSAVLGVVLGHRGALNVSSAPAAGTTFEVLLPAAPARQGIATIAPPCTPDGAVRTETVLVIDDEDIVRSVAKGVLSRCGLSVLTANGGADGIDVFRRHHSKVSLVVLDLTMPDMSGEEVLRELQAIRSDIKVLLSSGYSEMEIQARFAGKRLAGFVQKPYTAAALKDKVVFTLSR